LNDIDFGCFFVLSLIGVKKEGNKKEEATKRTTTPTSTPTNEKSKKQAQSLFHTTESEGIFLALQQNVCRSTITGKICITACFWITMHMSLPFVKIPQ